MTKKRTKEQQQRLREKRSRQRRHAQMRKRKGLEEMRRDNEINKNSRAIDKRINGFNGILDSPYMDLVRR